MKSLKARVTPERPLFSGNLGRLGWPLVMVAMMAPAALADTLMLSREGAAGDTGTSVQFWSGSYRIARIDNDGKMIGDLAAGMLYLISDQAKACHAISTRDADRDPVALQAAVEAVKFRKSGRSEQIGQWEAEVYELIGGVGDNGYEMVVWITDELTIDTVQRTYMESVATPETAAMLAVYELGGFPVRSEIQMGPIQMWSELESIEEMPAPAGTYEVPPGYSGCD